MKKNQNLFGWLIACSALLIGFLGVFNNSIIKAAEEEGAKGAQISNDVIKSYFDWGVSWQKNNPITITMALNDADEFWIPIISPYNRHLDKQYTFNLSEGDTKPQIYSSAFTYGLTTPVTEEAWPEITNVSPTINYEYTNPNYWTGLPSNNNGQFTSTVTNWDEGLTHWTGWPAGDVKTSAYIMYPKGSTKSDRLYYLIESSVPNTTSISVETHININHDSFIKPDKGSYFVHGIGWGIEIPQLVKAVFKDIDNPEGPSITADEVVGEGGKMGDNVSLSKKDINGYAFVESQIAYGPASRSGAYQVRTYNPEQYLYTNDFNVELQTEDTQWTTSLDNQQKGIVFWYRKLEPEISLQKTVDKDTVTVGDALNYSLKAENTGDASLEEGRITDTFPSGMSTPTEIKIDDNLISTSANDKGEYYSWNSTTRKFELFIGSIAEQSEKIITYSTTVSEGIKNEKKVNTAVLTGDNAGEDVMSEATVTITEPWKVTFESNGGTVVPDQIVKEGELAIEPPAPTYINKSFEGWYTESSLTNKWDFATPIFQDTQLYAKWVNIGTIKFHQVPATLSFGEAILPKSKGKFLYREPNWKLSVIDTRPVKSTFHVTAKEISNFTDGVIRLTDVLTYVNSDGTEKIINATSTPVVFEPESVSSSSGQVIYETMWGEKEGILFKVPDNAQEGKYLGEIEWVLNDGP